MENEESKVGTSDSHPIYVNVVPKEEMTLSKGTLGLTFAPGKWQSGMSTGLTWQRDLNKDLERIQSEYKTNTIVTLIERVEFETLKIPNLRKNIIELGMNSVWFPIRDRNTPNCGDETMAKFDILILHLVELLKKGDNIVVHCMGGMGRAGTVSACILTRLEKTAEDAITIIRQTRKGAVETNEQENFVKEYEKYISVFK